MIAETIPLGELTKVQTGKLDANASSKNGEYPFFTCAREPLKIDRWKYDLDAVLVAGNGDLNVKHYRGKFEAYQRTYILSSLNEQRLDTRYLFHFLDKYVEKLREQSIGGIIKYIKLGMLTGAEIPLPSLDEQKRIAAILDQADALRRMHQRAIDRLHNLGQAIFHEMFGSKLDDLKTVGLKELIQGFRYGTSNKSSPSGYPALRIPNIIGGKIDLTELKTVEVTEAELKRLKLIDGDMLFVRTNGNPDYVGRSAVFSRDAVASNSPFIYASYLIRARLSDQVNPIFLQSYLSSGIGRRALRERCKTSAGQYNINTEGLGSIPVPEIKKEHQDKFAVRKANIEEKMDIFNEGLQQSEVLFNSLQQRAFRGELG